LHAFHWISAAKVRDVLSAAHVSQLGQSVSPCLGDPCAAYTHFIITITMDSMSNQAASQAGLTKSLTGADVLQALWFTIPLDGGKSVSLMDPTKVATPSALHSPLQHKSSTG